MPCSLQYSWNRFEVYSPPQSNWRVISLWPLSASIRPLKCLKLVKAADFSLRMYTHNFLLKSSMKVIKYQLTPKVAGSNGSQMSVWTSCNGASALYDFSLGKGSRTCLPIMQPSQKWLSGSIVGKLYTMPTVDSSFRPLKFRWPKRRCHLHDSFSTSPWKHFPTFIFRCKGNMWFLFILKQVMRPHFAFSNQRWLFSIYTLYPFLSNWSILRILLFMLGI